MRTNTREAFIKALDEKISAICGLGYEDLPDTVMIDDYWYEGMSGEAFVEAVSDCANEILENAGWGSKYHPSLYFHPPRVVVN